jgi:hypothetical protein
MRKERPGQLKCELQTYGSKIGNSRHEHNAYQCVSLRERFFPLRLQAIPQGLNCAVGIMCHALYLCLTRDEIEKIYVE